MTNQSTASVIPTMAASLAAVLLVTAASSAIARPESAQDVQTGRVSEVCTSVLRLEQGEAQYVGCVDSLSASLHGIGQGRALQDAHESCLAQGLKPDTAALAVCTLQSSEIRPLSTKASDPAPTTVTPGGAKSYFSVSNRDQMRREQLACAQLGLDPVGSAFDGCVAGLRSALFAADNPSQ